MAGQFMPAAGFDPRLILFQIATVQAAFYLSWVMGTVLVEILLGFPASVGQFFRADAFSFGSSAGWLLIACYWADMAAMAFVIFRVIERTRKCLDFVLTMTAIHLFFSALACGFPASFSWWLVFGIGTAGCTLLAERLCLLEAQQDIELPKAAAESP